MGPQSALTDFLASRNISAAQIELNFRQRQEAAARLLEEEQAANGEGPSTLEGPSTPGTGAGAGATTADTPASESPQLSKSSKRTLDKIKAEKKKKKEKGKGNKKRKVFGSDEDEDDDDLALAIFRSANPAPLPGQMDNCGQCKKRFTVTPYSRADSTGKLLCSPCSRVLNKEDEDKKKKNKELEKLKNKEKEKDKKKAVGGRRKAASHLLDGGSIVGPKPLVQLCVEHLSRNIALADDLGDLPADVVDRIARMLSKRRLVDRRTIELFIQAASSQICTYDCSKMTEGDFMRMLQEMPRLKVMRLYNSVQFKNDVMSYLVLRDIQLETLMLYGANLLSADKWKEYLVSKGRHLRQLHIVDTDKHITDEVVQYIKECAPDLERLKIRGNQEVGGDGVEHMSHMKKIKHIGLGLQKHVHSDAYVKLMVRVGAGLQTFSVRNAEGVDNAVLAAMHESCRALRKLRMTENTLCTDEGFARLFTDWANPPLHFVDLEKCRYAHADMTTAIANVDGIGLCSKGFKALMAHSGQELRELTITSCRHIEKDAFEEVFAEGKTYPSLRRMDVSFCGEVTDEILYSMFRCCPSLTEVVTFGCMLVTGAQVPYGRVVIGVPNAIGMQTVGRAELTV